MTSHQVTYHIIGGGIAGLACAWLLRRKKRKAHIALYEAQEHIGGRAVVLDFDDTENAALNRESHIVSSQDEFMSQFVKPEEWKHNFCFFDTLLQKTDLKIRNNLECFYKIFGGDCSENLAPTIRKKIKDLICLKVFLHHKLWFPNKDLSKRVCNLLASAADDVFYGWRLQNMVSERKKIIKLCFNTKTIEVAPKDKIILALDNLTCQKFLEVNKLHHYAIANIIYQTSETIFFPKGVSFVGLKNSEADCIISEDNYVTAIISNCSSNKKKQQELAQKIWLQIDKVRKVNSAFLPPYKIIFNKNAAIRQDKETNRLRPKNAKTYYNNVFIAGDWTMRNYPCRMETAVKSAERAVKAATKLIF